MNFPSTSLVSTSSRPNSRYSSQSERSIIDHYWNDRLGALAWSRNGASEICVRRHSSKEWSNREACALVCGNQARLSVPTELHAEVSERARLFRTNDILIPERVSQLFASPFLRCTGPLYQGYLTRDYFTQRTGHDDLVRRRPRGPISQFGRLAARVGQQDWIASRLTDAQSDYFTILRDGHPVAVGHYWILPGGLASVGALTDPEYRRNGYAHRVLGAAIQDAFAQGLGVVYQSLKANRASLALAQALGCIHYGWSMQIELLDRAPSRSHAAVGPAPTRPVASISTEFRSR